MIVDLRKTRLATQSSPRLPEHILTEEILWVETGRDCTEADLTALRQFFINPLIERPVDVFSKASQPQEVSCAFTVAYKRGITDPECQTLVQLFRMLGIDALWVRRGTTYIFYGMSPEEALAYLRMNFYNSEVQVILPENFVWDTLVPQGQSGSVEFLQIQTMDLAALREMSQKRRLMMSDEKLLAMQSYFTHVDRAMLDAEAEVIGAAWSDHCSHDTWRRLQLLQFLKQTTADINHPLVVSAYEDNAGVMAFYHGWGISLKGETHISPTFAGDPKGGILTKHGGVIRDIIFNGLGGYPIAGTTVMATVDPHIPESAVPVGGFHPLVVLKGAISGTHGYTNPMGIPMAYSDYRVDARNWKGYALGHSVGLTPLHAAKKGKAKPGDLVVLIGGATGRDGLHGATVSSGQMTSDTMTMDSAHVQIGEPILEQAFMQAMVEVTQKCLVRATTDLGAAGLASGGEMGQHCGLWLNLAWVPTKCTGMAPWEVLLSESQERGLLAVSPEHLQTVLGIFADYEVPATVIGVFTDTGRFQVVSNPSLQIDSWLAEPLITQEGLVTDLLYSLLTDGCPLPPLQTKKPKSPAQYLLPRPKNQQEWVHLVQRVLGHGNVCDQSVIAHQYDQTVQGRTVLPYISGVSGDMRDDLAVLKPLRDYAYGCGIALATNQFLGDVSPAGLGQHVFVQALTQLVAAGFSPSEVVCCANVYTPRITDSPEHAWRLVELVKNGYGLASKYLRVPIISGKDSSSGTFTTQEGKRIDAPLTFTAMMVGRMPDVDMLIRKPFVEPGHRLVLLHPGFLSSGISLAGSVVLDLFAERGSHLTALNISLVRDFLARYHQMVCADFGRTIHSRSAIGEGGLIRRLYEMSIGGGMGCSVDFSRLPGNWLFGELSGAIIIATSSDLYRKYLKPGEYLELGHVLPEWEIRVSVKGKPLFTGSLEELGWYWEKTLSEVLV